MVFADGRALDNSMDAKDYLSFFHTKMLPETGTGGGVSFEGLDELVASCGEHADAVDVGFFHGLYSNLANRLALRHLPGTVRVLLSKDRRAGSISKLDLD